MFACAAIAIKFATARLTGLDVVASALVTLVIVSLILALTSEMFAGEVVRTLVGSIGLVLAVPITTAIAVAAVSVGAPRRALADS